MNWEAIGAIGEIASALAVLVTLAFLAYQVIQARDAIKTNAHQSYAHDKRELTMFLASKDIRSAFIQGLISPTDLDEDGRYIFHQSIVTFMFWLQTSHQLRRRGLISDEDWQTDFQLVQELRSSKGFQLWWPTCADFFEKEFVDVVNSTPPITDMGFERFVASLDAEKEGASDDA